MNKKFTLLLCSLVVAISAFAQVSLQPQFSDNTIISPQKNTTKYWIYFQDKNGSESLIGNPQKLLSPRAVERRLRFGIPINYSDLPVSSNNISTLKNMQIEPIVVSRWLNAVSANLTEDQVEQLSQMEMVSALYPVKRLRSIDENNLPVNENMFYRTADVGEVTGIFGYATNQIEQINLDTILDLGFTGNDMVIAVLDAGFFGVDTATLFNSFWEKEQILGVRNFPDHNNEVFNIGSGIHGSWVMSVIGGEVEDTYSGSAPSANFYLFRTEIADSEYVVEEDYWLEAAERADSLGVDLINSSLGYTTFDDPLENHTYEDLDGNTSVITKAADIAASKGILVCNSAGNEGANAWHYVSMPSDGDSVFSIGGVDTSGIHVGFSGYGPTFDGRIKPNVVALASGSAVLDPYGYVTNLGGTSFSSPLIAGACASLWEAFPAKNNMEIIDAVQRSAHLYLTPNDSMGYGIPNFGLAYEILLSETDTTVIDTTGGGDTTEIDTTILEIFNVLPNPASDFFTVWINSNYNQVAELQFFNMIGEMMYQETIYLNSDIANQITIDTRKNFAPGLYLFTVSGNGFKQTSKVFVE